MTSSAAVVEWDAMVPGPIPKTASPTARSVDAIADGDHPTGQVEAQEAARRRCRRRRGRAAGPWRGRRRGSSARPRRPPPPPARDRAGGGRRGAGRTSPRLRDGSHRPATSRTRWRAGSAWPGWPAGGAGATGGRPCARRGWRSRPRPAAARPRRRSGRRRVGRCRPWSATPGGRRAASATSGRSFMATRSSPHNGARTRSRGDRRRRPPPGPRR